MFSPVQLALTALLLVVATGAPAPAHAQIVNPNDLVSNPPKPPPTRERAHRPATGSLQWVWQYTQPTPGGNAVALRGDERFFTLIETEFKQPESFWGKPVPISAVIPRFLSGYGEVNATNNRYLTVDGCVPSFCAAHGMLWMDLGTEARLRTTRTAPEPLLVFAAVNWTTEHHTTDEASADYDLWLFPSRFLGAEALPVALRSAIAEWDARLASAHRGVPHILHALLVEPDGQPYPLDPKIAGANTLPAQPDTVTPKPPDAE